MSDQPDCRIILAKGQLDHSYTFWTMPILIFSPVQIIMKCPNAKSLSHCLTELFPIYQNNIWTIRQWDNHTIIPSYYTEDCRILDIHFHCFKVGIKFALHLKVILDGLGTNHILWFAFGEKWLLMKTVAKNASGVIWIVCRREIPECLPHLYSLVVSFHT